MSGFAFANENPLNKGEKIEGLTKRYRYTKSIKFVERGVEFYVFPNGKFDYNRRRISHRGRNGVNINYNSGNSSLYYRSIRKSPYRSISVGYDYLGRICTVGGVPVNYDRYGNVQHIGSVYVGYNRRNRVSSVGNLYIYYNRWGHISNLEGYVNDYNHKRRYSRSYETFEKCHKF